MEEILMKKTVVIIADNIMAAIKILVLSAHHLPGAVACA